MPTIGKSIQAYVFPDNILQFNLLSFSDLCNADCSIHLTKTTVSITYHGRVIFRGSKGITDTLWMIDLNCLQDGPLQSPIPSLANLTVKLDTDAEFVAFVHASFGSPPAATFLAAARAGWLDAYPLLTAAMISANTPNSIATAKGHLDQSRQRKSRRKALNDKPYANAHTTDTTEDDYSDIPDNVFVKTIPATDLAHADSTGRFPIASRKGNQYVLVYTWRGYAHYEPMPSRTAVSYLAAYTRAWQFFRQFDAPPSFMRMDNETSSLLEAFAKDQKLTIQYVPPGTHRANKAEREIRTSKNHLISMLCTCHESFPLLLWDEALPQAELTINHLRAYQLDPLKSAYEGLHGQRYDFAAHPIAPFGTMVVVHDKPASRGSWDVHGETGFYLGPALQHFKCWRTWIVSTNSQRISDTLAWFPAPLKLPGSHPYAMITAALQDLTSAIKIFAVHDKLTPSQSQHIISTTGTAVKSLNEVIHMFTSVVSPLDIPMRIADGMPPQQM